MRYLITLILTLILCAQTVEAQNSIADSIATSKSIYIKKDIAYDFEIYDYGQTQMKLTPIKLVTSQGNIFYSELYLETPDNSTTINISLDETRKFLKKLYGIYQINGYKDSPLNKHPKKWQDQKTYYFSISDNIYFQLEAAEDGDPESTTASGSINHVNFTINDFGENKRRTSKTIDRLMEIVSDKKNDLATKLIEDHAGISGYKIDHQKFYQEGLEVYDSNIHKTDNLRVLSEQKIVRQQRKIPVNEYNGQFEEYSVVYDRSLNFYAQEDISISSFVKEVISLVQQYDGDGVLDLNIYQKEDYIYSTFSIVESKFKVQESKGRDS